MQKIAPLLGRILLSGIFLMSAFGKITDFAGSQAYMESKGMPMTGLLLAGAIVLELFGGLSLVTGFKARLGALALIIFLIPATLIFHTNFADQMEVIAFLKNLSILGGLLMVYAFGPGSPALGSKSS
ncbi:MAG: DoxX family protein [Acidobacteriota bacterium]